MIPETEWTPKGKGWTICFAIYLQTELLTPWSWPPWCRAPGPRPPWRGRGGRPAEARACWTLASSLDPAAFIPGQQVPEPSSRTWGQLKQLNNPESCKGMNEMMHDPAPLLHHT